MRIEVKITTQNQAIVLPSSHNHILQGFIYSLMEASLRRKIHEQGFQYEKRRFRLFTFSRLYGKFRNIDNQFHFTPPVKLIISSSQKEILQSIAENLVKTDKFYIGKNEVFIESINVLPQPQFRDKLIIKMLSPVTCYSTLKKADGRKKTYYYSPFEQEFPLFIKENLRKKFKLIYGSDNCFEFNISPYRVSARDEKIIIYNRNNKDKGTVIKGWMGLYEISGSKKALELAYDVGLGAKNSQGFGCWEAINNN
ncbi:MAG: CRISPR-associated endoribonuclease Cas6 [Candidatus Omnitrophota bacterium]|nr:MAG: CRISPR-associated endoribonuclease Cas6 [Candidatus Omnitrophota bacterium]RKY42647.1 MAG: CRISPR-associated endoribonuclease Cas6 [Candidatus Omnitrophota bacterium]